MNNIRLYIIAFNKQHFNHICHLYRIPRDQTYYVSNSQCLLGLHPDNIIMFGDRWWENKTTSEVDMIEQLVKVHNERRSRASRADIDLSALDEAIDSLENRIEEVIYNLVDCDWYENAQHSVKQLRKLKAKLEGEG